MSDGAELYYAHMEADRNAAEAAFFQARPSLGTEVDRALFRAGYERAYQRLWPLHGSPSDDETKPLVDLGGAACAQNAAFDDAGRNAGSTPAEGAAANVSTFEAGEVDGLCKHCDLSWLLHIAEDAHGRRNVCTSIFIESHSGRPRPGERSACLPADDRGIAEARSSEGGNVGKKSPAVSIQSREPAGSNSASVGRPSPEQIHAKDVDAAPSLALRAYEEAMMAAGVPHEPLEVYESNSFRRVGLARTYREVMTPTVSPADRHPDIRGVDVLRALVAAFNAMLEVRS